MGAGLREGGGLESRGVGVGRLVWAGTMERACIHAGRLRSASARLPPTPCHALKRSAGPCSLPPEPYVVLRTDYTSYALVRGAKDRSFVQARGRAGGRGGEVLS